MVPISSKCTGYSKQFRHHWVTRCLASGLLGLVSLGIAAAAAARAESSSSINLSEHLDYFPRRGELQRCLVTAPDNCIFEYSDVLNSPLLPAVARDLSLEYRQAALLTEVAVQLSAIGDDEYAKALIHVSSYVQPKVLALTAIAAQQADAQQWEQAEQTLAEATDLLETTSAQGYLNVQPLVVVAGQYAAMGQLVTARTLLQPAIAANTAVQSAEGLYFYGRGNALSHLAIGLLTTGDRQQAEQLVGELLQTAQFDEAVSSPFYPSIFEPLLRDGQHEFLAGLAETVDDPVYRNRWLSEICIHLVDAGEYAQASQLLQILEDIDQPPAAVNESGDERLTAPRLSQTEPAWRHPNKQTVLSRGTSIHAPLGRLQRSPDGLLEPLPPSVPSSLPTTPLPSVNPLPIPTRPSPMAFRTQCLATLERKNSYMEPAAIAIQLAAEGEIDAAIAVAQLIPSSYYSMMALVEIAIVLEQENPEQFLAVLEQALDAADRVDQTSTVALNHGLGIGRLHLAIRLAEAGLFDLAQEISQTLEDDTYGINILDASRWH
ncbi:MAG: hypothetical protein ACFBSG_08120 [Leptolyngbyaceae cyanobacterium]